MSKVHTGGAVLTLPDVSEIAVRIGEMWDQYNTERRNALTMGEEARRYVFATDIDQTSGQQMEHKNRTHQPKLTQISDNLQSQYFEASLSSPDFYKFDGSTEEDQDAAASIEAWIRVKLEQRKFRETTGRELLADYVNYGNCFVTVDYVIERNDVGEVVYKGPSWERVSPLDIVFNSRTKFHKSPKLQRELVHVAEVAEYPDRYPGSNFDQRAINKAIETRHPEANEDWIQVIKNRGINMDGFGGYDSYFKQDQAEIIVYRGDVFNPDTGEVQRNRVVYIMDRAHVIRNEPSASPSGFDGVHHAGWRIRNDNTWAQGPLDNIVGIQYRIDHLENLKADVFDQIAIPIVVVKGEDVIEPEDGFAPGATYYVGLDGAVEFVRPDPTALNANNEIALYHRMMEEFAGAPPESRGVRTPGEKTAFEVSKLDQNAAMMFVDRARNFERMLETMLKETFEIMLVNYDGGDFVEIFDDITQEARVRKLSQTEVQARGDFTATGARHWTRRNRESLELKEFMAGPLQDPKIRSHTDGYKLAELWERKLNLAEDEVIEQYAGVKEDVRMQAVAQAESDKIKEESGTNAPVGDVANTGAEVQQGQEGAEADTEPGPELPGVS